MPLEAAAGRPGLYVLHVERRQAELPLLRLGIAAGTAERSILVPALASTDYLVSVPNTARFTVDDAEASALTIRRAGLLDRLRSIERPRVSRPIRLAVDGIAIRPLLRGTGAEGRALAKAMRVLTRWGFGLASANLQQTPELLFDHDTASEMHPPLLPAGEPRFVIVLHLYYEDLWPEFEHFLSRIRLPFRLIITTPHGAPIFADAARRAFPSARIATLPNRGRDVAPFLHLLNEGAFDGFEFVLKLHGKRTAITRHHGALGHVWRRASIIDLAGSDETIRRILARFAADPSIGMIGSARFRAPGSAVPEQAAWGANRAAILALTKRIGLGEISHLDYFAGTMFWVRRKALEPLRRLNLSDADFPEEQGQRDGELHHALERLFGTLPGLSGMRLESVPPRLET
ncbi:MAG TPA: rhamnan synthesis F family protein [Bauldia sp.]|nr:rhamnan synthesis F family protein [Bauldia sp.]